MLTDVIDFVIENVDEIKDYVIEYRQGWDGKKIDIKFTMVNNDEYSFFVE